MSRNQNRKSGNESNPTVALITTLLGLGYVVFVFVYDDLKRDPFVQGISGIIVALFIAIILFSAVSGSRATVKLPISLAGAAAFYIILLPQIKPYVFSLNSYTGYVAVECGGRDKYFLPVQGAVVEIKDTDLKATTNDTGKFTIPNVPSQVTISELIISQGGNHYNFNVKENPDNVFHIPPEPLLADSNKDIIDAGEWIEDKSECRSDDPDKKYSTTKQFSLSKSVPRKADYSAMLIEVSALEGAEIISARKLEPPEGTKVQSEEGYTKVQKWQIPLNDNEAKLRLSICIGTIKRGVQGSSANLKTAYWFQKVETKKCLK